MNTFQNSTNCPANCTKIHLSETQQALLQNVRDFFLTDKCSEIIGSMNELVEALLFSKDLENITPAMRVDIANQLRAVTLISKLNEGRF
ncbi:hypothetical protein [Dyadobacter aurulentus]|uniref:hypothetical protein n=1 Tax=Dyadobacter sp. UC 10 TaxID=2605428 RepID=UPI0011F1BB18|nr:hypothetical protein [Dyadobacter sp. UC 10]KAA0990283.1 hypothetical protein FXO21_09000 [Dyadobacter sp. UC 10]